MQNPVKLDAQAVSSAVMRAYMQLCHRLMLCSLCRQRDYGMVC